MKEEIIEKEGELLNYLLNKFNKMSRNSVKNLLKKEQIVVNGKVITQFNYMLKKGDKISFDGKRSENGLKIIYEDDLFLAIDKVHNLLTVASDHEKEKTAFVQVSKYVKQKNDRNKIFVLHRLDKDTSGVIIFCKDEKIKNDLQDKWNDIVTKREYIAVVEGKIEKKEGEIRSYLKEDLKSKMVYPTSKENGKLAITKYKVLKQNDKYSLIKVELLTGRKNQIRVHFKELRHPLVGDKKYGAVSDPLKRLCLHASEITFEYEKKEYLFKSKRSNIFDSLIK